jgi:hypothetical protein
MERLKRIKYLLRPPGVGTKLVRKIISLKTYETGFVDIEDNGRKTTLKATVLPTRNFKN